jgi:hypothetical protein
LLLNDHSAPSGIRLENTGTERLVFSVVETIDWLAVSPRSGGVPGLSSVDLTIVATHGSRPAGTYVDSLFIESNDPARPRVWITAVLTVVEAPPPRLTVDADSIDFQTVNWGLAPSRSLIVRNMENGSQWVRFIRNAPWLVSPDSVHILAGSIAVGVRVETRTLPRGVHHAELTVSMRNSGRVLSVIPVTVRVVEPEVNIDPPELRFSIPPDGEAKTMPLRVLNTGDGMLGITVSGDPPLPPWLSVSPGLGLGPGSRADLAFTARPDGLQPGTHESVVVLMTTDRDEGMIEIRVFLEVAEAPPPPPDLTLERITPNPARGDFRITVLLPDAGPASVDMVDVFGRRVFHREIPGGPGRLSIPVTGSRLGSGVYWIRLSQGGLRKTARVTVTK